MAGKTIIVRGPTYFAPGDEKAFFDWPQAIPCVESVGGRVRDLHIRLKRPPSDSDLRELIALLYRYRMNMKVLAAFKTSRNAAWFFDKSGMFWHRKVFGSAKRH
jgi:hypothetical protein